MSLESFNFIDSLNASNPTTTDNVSEGDDHIRGIKSTLKTTFPSINAAITATDEEINLLDGVTATTAELNYVDGVTSNIQTQLGTKLPLAGGTMTGTIAGFTSTGIDDNATSTAITINSAEDVGIGTSSPVTLVEAWADTPEITITSNNPLSTSVGSENISSIGFRGQYNNLYRTSARIQARQNGTWSTGTSNIAPTAIDFFTQTSGTGDGMPTPKVSILATGGITFNGDTAAANALDDYEEGTWTPVIGGDSGTSGQTYSVQDGYYTKIGNTVTCNGRATLSAKGTLTGGIIITGLPFSSNGTTTYRNPGSVGYFGSLGASVVDLSINMTYGVSTITVYKLSAAGIVRETMDTTDITNTTQIDIAITYKV